MNEQELFEKAKEASKKAYAPYSHFHVGAALLCTDGTVVTGCNIENASYGLCLCAERIAITKAVSEGKTQFKTLALYAERGVPEANPIPDFGVRPCGACLQVMAEFFQEQTVIMCPSDTQEPKRFNMRDLLPHAFGL